LLLAAGFFVSLRVEGRVAPEPVIIPALALGAVHRAVGALHQGFNIIAIKWINGEADTGRNAGFMPFQRERPGQRAKKFSGGLNRRHVIARARCAVGVTGSGLALVRQRRGSQKPLS
jgi:hypothetical protein